METPRDDADADARRALDLGRLRGALLEPAGPLQRLEGVVATGSTNDDLAALGPGWPAPNLLTAEEQLSGKGRLGRSWSAPLGSSLAASLFLRPSGIPDAALGWLSLLSAVALCRALEEFDVGARIKWPNDVVVPQQDGAALKIAGILLRLVSPGPTAQVIIGTGINVSQSAEELPVPTATSVLLAGGRVDRESLLIAYVRRVCALVADFEARCGNILAPGPLGEPVLHAVVASLLHTLGQQVRAELPGGRLIYGTASGLDAQGALLLIDAQGVEHTVSAADVVHLRRSPGATGSYA
ncbi:biotin--[acetyl-CoA-carboxylase] ligase [Psychromicrobium xiongbiense]|uniref:biotin--[acetyl-CoA-carboxylase] ligase n=1 Tax=Psychromicrobium xiongbiense TaxID=3051184 RepID=UPI0025558E63|nr:biotin--[acetyl-CoA-carboxylase] ligase [Psychromicrobium sp. YIM S02556]